ncbi:hypothetical protein [Kaistella palustris]|uniref:hypothetical protein n=1 Tax=Kaistella palustris TaxID=493376 RepID=UPI0004066CBB|nr:hypothetical protein [Kaistella palustris]
MKKFAILSSAFLLMSCTKEVTNGNSVQETGAGRAHTTVDDGKENSDVSKEQNLKNLNDSLLKSLEDKNYSDFANFIHPKKGVTFSMYGHVDPERSKHFTKEEFTQYLPTHTKFTWGEKDGTGELLVLSIKDYFDEWIYRANFATGEYALNTYKGEGNSSKNIREIFPNADFTENYVAGSQASSGMDWKSLRFVFEQFEGQYYLIAVVNDQWTI